MGVPKRKVSKMRLRTRKAANRWHAPSLGKCPTCDAPVHSHTVCSACGTYRNRQILDVTPA
ncbi:MAG: 50S ribosomal protein L32 [Verrucomicrobiae bacterium]|nr:50S ribosomal protein L32 [Verrucomicrobiae bacterium]